MEPKCVPPIPPSDANFASRREEKSFFGPNYALKPLRIFKPRLKLRSRVRGLRPKPKANARPRAARPPTKKEANVLLR